MFCVSCGKELPDDANFCLKCGKPLRGGTQAGQEKAEQWEVCQIETKLVKKPGFFAAGKSVYYADAVGPKGTYVAGQSPEDEGTTDKGLDILVNQLVQEGWEYVGTYAFANWTKKFRRRVQ